MNLARTTHAASPLAATSCADSRRGLGADRRRGGDPDGRTRPAGQSRRHSPGRKPDQAGGAAFQLLASVSQIRRQEQCEPLQFKLDESVTAIINEYVHDFRPVADAGQQRGLAVPGRVRQLTRIRSRSAPRSSSGFEKSTGMRITVHQFRHAAGALILKHRPGDYELVRRILGHKSIQTTHQVLLQPGDHAGERDLHRHHPPEAGLRAEVGGLHDDTRNNQRRRRQAGTRPAAAALRPGRPRSLPIAEWTGIRSPRVGAKPAGRRTAQARWGG